jgi:hypothetical protein
LNITSLTKVSLLVSYILVQTQDQCFSTFIAFVHLGPDKSIFGGTNYAKRGLKIKKGITGGTPDTISRHPD